MGVGRGARGGGAEGRRGNTGGKGPAVEEVVCLVNFRSAGVSLGSGEGGVGLERRNGGGLSASRRLILEA